MTLHIFNPDHDMVLACGMPGYMPPKVIQRMADDLAWLPRLWADDGFCMADEVPWRAVSRVEPWGWDAAVKHRLLRRGVPECALESDEYIGTVRRLSSRKLAVEALREFRHAGIGGLCGESVWVESMDAMPNWGDMVLKAPWSSSGKGLLFVIGTPTGTQRGRCRNILALQGGLAVERICRKQHDFAMEYEVSNGRVCFLGLSLFENSRTGAYTGNLLMPQADKLRILGIDKARLMEMAALHTDFLTRRIAPHYHGPVGIDMMTTVDGSINPCVEINLRRTMGHVALAIERRLGTDVTSRFVVGYDKDNGYFATIQATQCSASG